jgi:hypothetical protein
MIIQKKSNIQQGSFKFQKVLKSLFKRCAGEILDDFIPTCRQDGDMVVGVREEIIPCPLIEGEI